LKDEHNNNNVQESPQGFWKKHKVKWIILLLCIGIAIAIWNISLSFYEQWQSEKQEARIQAAAQPTETLAPQETPIPTVSQEPIRKIEFETLLEQNPEISAWIEIPGTKIDYPVVQGEDNVFYLDHDALLEENVEGAIFVDAENTPGFSDRNTILYGHRMNNGNMFAGLHAFSDPAFFEENRVIYLYFPDGTRTEYEIFAAYETGDEYILGEWDFASDSDFSAYLEQIGADDENANVREIEVGMEDKILTLSTCVRGEDEKRYLVQAVLRPDETIVGKP
jgi:sortase B